MEQSSLLYQLYVRQEFEECQKLCDELLQQTKNRHEHALHIKALIARHEGKIQQSLALFQQATALNPANPANLKQVGRCLVLMGKHRSAVEVYEEALGAGGSDWEAWHNKGACYAQLGEADKALECFQSALAVQPQDETYLAMAQVHVTKGDLDAALATYNQGLAGAPKNAELLTALGLLLLRMGDHSRAFDALGSALAQDPRQPRTILAAGSIIQDHADYDVALVKYRVGAVVNPDCPQLWNNIGMCFFGKQKYIAAIACLKKALYLGPFEWLVAYNLGLAHLTTGQAASAFHYLSASINLRGDFAHSYMYLGTALARLEDLDNGRAAYARALALSPGEPLVHINHALMLWRGGLKEEARAAYASFRSAWEAAQAAGAKPDADILEQSEALGAALGAA